MPRPEGQRKTRFFTTALPIGGGLLCHHPAAAVAGERHDRQRTSERQGLSSLPKRKRGKSHRIICTLSTQGNDTELAQLRAPFDSRQAELTPRELSAFMKTLVSTTRGALKKRGATFCAGYPLHDVVLKTALASGWGQAR
ncbi:MAG: hypothetical protein ACYTFN_25160 [Planctomycetota bacterium]|jgi:hypothetical protein